MSRLSPEQDEALERVRLAHRAKVTARQDAMAEAERMVAQAVHDAAMVESRAVRAAIKAEVPRRQIGRIGLDTSDYATVAKVLALSDGDDAAERRVEQVATRERSKRLTLVEGHTYRIDWPGYSTERSTLRAQYGADTVDLHGTITSDDPYWNVDADDDANTGRWAHHPLGVLQVILDEDAELRDALNAIA